MNDVKFNEKLIEFLIELAKPKKYEAGYVEAKRTVSEGLAILGLDANDILGFVKSDNERRIRRVRGSQAWFKKMYGDGWKYAGNFEYEGLMNNGFIVMERELPNKTLNVIREELEALLKEDEGSKYIHVPDPEKLRETAVVNPYALHATDVVKFEKRGDLKKAILKAREPREGFESDVNDFMIDAQKELKTLEEVFFEETGKNAVWHGKETKAFKSWKEEIRD